MRDVVGYVPTVRTTLTLLLVVATFTGTLQASPVTAQRVADLEPEETASADARRRQGHWLKNLGLPLLAAGLVTTGLGVSGCYNQPATDRRLFAGGLAVAAVGVGFSTAGLVLVLRNRGESRFNRTRLAAGLIGTSLALGVFGVSMAQWVGCISS